MSIPGFNFFRTSNMYRITEDNIIQLQDILTILYYAKMSILFTIFNEVLCNALHTNYIKAIIFVK